MSENYSLEYSLDNLEQIYSKDGPLAEIIPDYVSRSQQVELANKIKQTLKTNKTLLAEAGTGTGKTLAYLIPAILSNNPVIVSTGTKNLQNQLFFRDLPVVIKSLKLPIKIALLKGRANYLCKYRLELALTDILLSTSEMVLQLKQIVNWSDETQSGDISTLDEVPEDAAVWQHVTSTPDNCLAQDCPFISNCFVYKARQAALEAKVIVINHHLLLSDWGIKSEKLDAKLLPQGVNLILDEAHQLPHIATNYFGTVASSKKIKLLIQDIILEQNNNAKDAVILVKTSKVLSDILDKIQKYLLDQPARGFYNILGKKDIFNLLMSKFYDALQELLDVLEINSDRSKGLLSCYERAVQIFEDIKIFYQSDKLESIQSEKSEKNKKSEKIEKSGNLALSSSSSSSSSVGPAIAEHTNIKWYEVYKQNFIFKQSPLDISEVFAENLEGMARASILTSATLSVANSFDMIQSDLGLKTCATLSIKSPFDYANKSILYLPRNMPDPMSDSYIDNYVNQVLPVLKISNGQAFLLFTSFNAMHMAYDLISERLSDDSFNLLMQGQASKTSLIERFRAKQRSVLFATASFWEGVDVKGSDLHCVVIDKLPFAAPSDPVLQSKINWLRKKGENPFITLQCQQAALQLTQGAGRLIRSEHDYGVLMICDPRILSRSYGEMFLNSLPDMARTRELAKIEQFYDLREGEKLI